MTIYILIHGGRASTETWNKLTNLMRLKEKWEGLRERILSLEDAPAPHSTM